MSATASATDSLVDGSEEERGVAMQLKEQGSHDTSHNGSGQQDTSSRSEELGLYECVSTCWRYKIITIEPIVFLYIVERYLSLLLSSLYFYQRYARDKLNETMTEYFCINASYLDDVFGDGTSDSVDSKAANFTFLVVVGSVLVAVASTIVIGPLTDQFGRKFALISVYIGRMLGELFVLIIVYYDLDLDLFIVSAVVSSAFGDYGVFVMAVTAYVADISTHTTRLLRIGVLSLITFVATALITVTGGIWIDEVNCDFRPVAWGPFVCCLVGILMSLFLVPESLPKEQRRTSNVRGLKAIWIGLSLYLKPKLVTIKLWICLVILLVFITINRGTLLIENYFFIRRPLEWSPDQIGYFGGYNSVTHGLALLILMPIALAVGIPDVVLAIVGVLCSGLGYLFIAGVKETWHMYAISSFQGVESVIIPSIHSLMSKCVGKTEQGALFAFVSSVESLGTILGSAVFINLYTTLHQSAYFIMALLAFVNLLPLGTVAVLEMWSKRRRLQTISDDEKLPLT